MEVLVSTIVVHDPTCELTRCCPPAVAYNSQTGLLLLAAGFVVSLLAYQAMKKIGRLPQEPRVIEGSSLSSSSFHHPAEDGEAR